MNGCFWKSRSSQRSTLQDKKPCNGSVLTLHSRHFQLQKQLVAGPARSNYSPSQPDEGSGSATAAVSSSCQRAISGNPSSPDRGLEQRKINQATQNVLDPAIRPSSSHTKKCHVAFIRLTTGMKKLLRHFTTSKSKGT